MLWPRFKRIVLVAFRPLPFFALYGQKSLVASYLPTHILEGH